MSGTKTIAAGVIKVGDRVVFDTLGTDYDVKVTKITMERKGLKRTMFVEGKDAAGAAVKVSLASRKQVSRTEKGTGAGATAVKKPSSSKPASAAASGGAASGGGGDKPSVDLSVDKADAGAALTVPVRAGELKKGSYVVMKGQFPCKVIELTTSKTGKHGHAKANITAVDIFTGAKYMDVSPTSHNMLAPVVTPSDWTLQFINKTDTNEKGHYATTLQNEDNVTREDLFLPPTDEFKGLIADIDSGEMEVTVTVISAMGTEKIMPAYKSVKVSA